MLKYFGAIALLALVIGCRENVERLKKPGAGEQQELGEILPFNSIDLTNLDAFEEGGDNWKITGGLYADLEEKHHLEIVDGHGILANLPDETSNKNLFTKLTHGDLELHFDVMVPKESNSGVYFQGRYEVQLFDSWGQRDPSHADIGGIYQRWDDARPEGQKGYEGYAPKVNAAKAPGLWQHFHILFRAPRFDSQGNKISDAQFEFVNLNGFMIHQDVSVSGPTRASGKNDEVALGPLMIQGDHGPVAFRNIRYKTYGADTLELEELTFSLYDGKWDYIPDFDTLTPTDSGPAPLFDPKSLTEKPDHYGMIFKGQLVVKRDGDYLFETKIDDGGDLYIDSTLVVANEGEPGVGTERGLIHLLEGIHHLKMTFYQEVWNASIRLSYEGPEVSKRALASNVKKPDWMVQAEKQAPITVSAVERPELIRGFVDQGPNKITHAISVGDPSGTHYSYNLADASLIKSWHGDFADVTNMWRGRGASQLTVPMNASVEYLPGLSLAQLTSEDANWPTYKSDAFKFEGYRIDPAGSPHFRYSFQEVDIDDHIIPSEGGRLKRTLSFTGDEISGQLWHRIGSADQIFQLENGLYSIGGQYYIDIKGNATTRKNRDGEELVVTVTPDQKSAIIEYEILW